MTDPQALAQLAIDARTAMSEPASIDDAVARIRIWRTALQTISAVAEAQVMAACWTIRRQSPNDAAFATLVEDRLRGVLSLDRATAMAQTWDVARRQRAVRQLAMDSPGDAILFVREFAEALGDGRTENLDEDDREVAALLAAPARARRERLREMIRRRREASSAASTAAPARGGPAGEERPAPAQRRLDAAEPRHFYSPAMVLDDLRMLEPKLAVLARHVGNIVDDPRWGPNGRDVFLRLVDRASSHLDRCSVLADDIGSTGGE